MSERVASVLRETEPSDAVRSLPYYDLVPKDVQGNAEYRIKLIDWAAKSKENRQKIINACAQDPLWYINSFVFTYDPRPKLADNPLYGYEERVVPFITYPFQDNLVMEIVQAVRSGYSLVVPKCRTTGVSVCGMTVFDWFARFFRRLSFLVGSRKFEYVDDPGVYDALLPKIDLIHEKQPGWLRPILVRNSGKLIYQDTKSVITGEATNPNFGRSGRSTATWTDEFAFVDCASEVVASIMENSPCNIIVSTPHGTGNTFYELAHNPGLRQFRIPWYHHPIYNKGLYADESGEFWSPWLLKMSEIYSAQYIAQEYRIDWTGSDFTFYSQTMLANKISLFACEPKVAGSLDLDDRGNPLGFSVAPDGLLRLWTSLQDGHPPRESYVLGIDIAAGTVDHHGRGYSNSVASVVNRATGEKVAEWAVSGIDTIKFARMCVAMARWFCDAKGTPAFMIWDATGPTGGTFTKAIIDLGFSLSRVWFNEKFTEAEKQSSGRPGWWLQGSSRDTLLRTYGEMLSDDRFVNHSLEALKEARDYIQLRSGEIVYSRSEKTEDPTGARANHGDRVIADALACWVLNEKAVAPAREEKPVAQYGSLAWRTKVVEEEERRKNKPWLQRRRRELSLLWV